MDLPEDVKAMFSRLGRKGGKKRMSRLSKKQRRDFAMMGVRARAAKKNSS